MAEFRNPNLQAQGSDGGGSGGGSNSMMVFGLLAVVLFLSFQFFSKPKAPVTTAPTGQTQNQSQPQQPAPMSAMTALPQSATTQSQPATPTIAASMVTQTTIENDNYKIVFTNQGAQVTHWILKHYSDTSGKPLDMVQPQAAALFGRPLSLYTYEPALTTQINQALYQMTASGAQPSVDGLAKAPATNALTFHYAADGIEVVKTFRFDSSYVITAETEVTRNGAPVRALLQWPAGLGDMEEFMGSSKRGGGTVPMSASSLFTWSIDGKDNSTAAKKVSGNATSDQPYEYAGITDLYFAATFLPDQPSRATVVTLHNSIDLASDPSDPNSQKRSADVLGLAVGDTSGTTRLRLFVGPKETDLLKTIRATGPDGKATGPSLESLIQLGWLAVIAKPLYMALRFFHDHLGSGANNWGWAIIVFTALFNLIMMPTRFWAMKSSLKMMRIQPKVEVLKNRYKNYKINDPKRAEMNTEMMQLYKDEGVNMYGSCLPMLPQIPLFFAYFRVLQNAVELRQAHWFWLTDLSSPDPLHILPIIIIVSMLVVQLITPSPGMDVNQRRTMAIMMPVMFGFMLWHYASGLALYWGTSNLINLALQLGINQSSMGKEMHAIAAKRAAKKPSTINAGPIQKRR